MYRYIIFLTILIVLTGCWDQRYLKDHSLILAIGYDITDDGKIKKTIAFPVKNGGAQQSDVSQKSETITIIGDTVKDAEIKTDELSPEKFDRSKARIILIGEKLAKQGVFPSLDSLYRDLRAPLNASVAIIEGDAEDALQIENTYALLVSDFFSELIITANDAGIVENKNVQEICPVILTEGIDATIPFLKLTDDKKKAKIDGGSLFHDDKLTGSLSLDENIMLITLMDKKNKHRKMNFKVDEDEKNEQKKHVNFSIRHLKRKIEINKKQGDFQVDIYMDMQVEIDEFAKDHLYDKKRAKTLTKQIEKEAEKLAKKTLEKIQEANSDVLGIGARVKAYHHKQWNKKEWEVIYPNIKIEPHFNVKIVRHGILN